MAFHNKVWNNSTVFPHFPQLVESGVFSKLSHNQWRNMFACFLARQLSLLPVNKTTKLRTVLNLCALITTVRPS